MRTAIEDPDADDPWIVHTAGPPVGAIQACAACGHVLQDNAAWFEGRVAVLEGQEHDGPMWWSTGALIAELGICTAMLPDRPLDPDERLCGGAN